MFISVKRSIHRKFIAVIAITLFLVNIPLLSAYFFSMHSSLMEEFEIKNQAIISTNISALEQPMWDYDYSTLPRWAQSMVLEDTIAEVRIFDHQKKLVAKARAEDEGQQLDSSKLTVVSKEIRHDVDGRSNLVGQLEMHFNKAGITEMVWSLLFRSIALLSVSIGAILVSAIIANRYFIVRPLGGLKTAMKLTLETGQTHSVDGASQDEIGQVAAHFNQMQERLEAESEKIRLAHENLTDLYNRTPALLYSLDANGKIQAVSDFWLAATGYFEDEVIGRDFSDFICDCCQDKYVERRSFLELQPGEFTEITCSFRKRDGSEIDVLIRESVNQDALSSVPLSLAVMTDVSNLKDAQNALRQQAETDSLTGLLNRAGFTHLLSRQLEVASDNDGSAALLFLDLDRFKWVNDNLGHCAGDELLQVVGSRISELLLPGESVSRFGGDEFAILVQGKDTYDRATDLSEKIMSSLAQPVKLYGRRFDVSVSIGISQFPDHAKDTDELVRTADVAMYHRKKSGRTGYTFFNDQIGQAAGRFLETEDLITTALDNDWFELHLQPIIELDSDCLAGFEALLRLRHPEKGLIPPAEIISVAEKSSRILDIGDRVISMAMQHLETFKATPYLQDCYLAVNFSAAQFLPGLPARLASQFMKRNLSPDKLVVEITETVLMQNADGLVDIFDAIKDLGCRFALDDFGTGYSSLSYMSKFPVSIVKIDRSFLMRIASEAESGAEAKTLTLVEGIVAMSHRLGLKVVAEGIETDADLTKMTDLGVDLGQGYLLSKPLPIESFIPDLDSDQKFSQNT